MKGPEIAVTRLMRDQLSLVTRDQARSLGMSDHEIRYRVTSGAWMKLHSSVFGAAGAGPGPERDLLAACLAGPPQAVASHQSAAWLRGLQPAPPRPVLTVPYGASARIRGVVVHRSRDLDQRRVLVRRGIPYTDALRVLTDLAGELDPPHLTPIVDRALAKQMVRTDGLMAEVRRRARPGLRGPARLQGILASRGLIAGPEPSVLEAVTLRLFHRWHIPVLGREIKTGPHGRYRIDFLITPTLVVEVDGYSYHWSPEDKTYDDARRNRLRSEGLTVLVYDWRRVRCEERHVATEILALVAPSVT